MLVFLIHERPEIFCKILKKLSFVEEFPFAFSFPFWCWVAVKRKEIVYFL